MQETVIHCFPFSQTKGMKYYIQERKIFKKPLS